MLEEKHGRRGGSAKELEGLSVESEEQKSPRSSCLEPWAFHTVPLSPPNPRISGPTYLHSRYDTNRTKKQQAEIEQIFLGAAFTFSYFPRIAGFNQRIDFMREGKRPGCVP